MLSTYGDCVNRYIDRGTMCCIKVIWKHFQIDLVCYSLSGESGCWLRTSRGVVGQKLVANSVASTLWFDVFFMPQPQVGNGGNKNLVILSSVVSLSDLVDTPERRGRFPLVVKPEPSVTSLSFMTGGFFPTTLHQICSCPILRLSL